MTQQTHQQLVFIVPEGANWFFRQGKSGRWYRLIKNENGKIVRIDAVTISDGASRNQGKAKTQKRRHNSSAYRKGRNSRSAGVSTFYSRNSWESLWQYSKGRIAE